MPIVSEGIYHICNRATEGRKIFVNARDCQYFLENILLSNTTDNRNLSWRRTALRTTKKQKFDLGDPLVAIYALCLMPNHFHILLKQLVDNGVPVLLQRACNSYGKYYNQKYERKGSLFMSRYKAVRIGSDVQVAHILTYIHGNPLDMKEPRWRDGKMRNWGRALQFLRNYSWSSLGIYSDASTHPLIKEIINRDFKEEYFPRNYNFLGALKDWSSRSDGKIYLE